MKTVSKVCPQCKEVFQVKASRLNEPNRGRFCSKGCATKHRYSQAGQGEVLRVCEYCGKEFIKEGWVVRKGKGKFCSKECYTSHAQIQLVCAVCNKNFSIPRWLSRNNRKCCSLKCSAKYRAIHYRGEKHINWKGGPTLYPPEWTEEFKKSIRKRDGYSCVVCNKKQRSLHVHHIDWDKQNTIPENCISLCSHHHLKAHAPRRAETWKILLSVAAKMRMEGWTEGAAS